MAGVLAYQLITGIALVCGVAFDDISEQSQTNISSDPCLTWANNCSYGCENKSGEVLCVCPSGFRLASEQISCEDIDECAEDSAYCEQVCWNVLGSAYCSCIDGYVLNHDNRTCVDVDPGSCEPFPNSKNCSQLCIMTQGEAQCSCQSGFRLAGDGVSCDDIDECTEITSVCDQESENLLGSFNCTCHVGFVLNDDLTTCVRELDPCELLANNNNCTYGCRVEDGRALCFCPAGFQLAVDGVSCDDVNKCTSSPCTNGTCTNYAGGFNCSCGPGTVLQHDQVTCQACDDVHYGHGCSSVCPCQWSNTLDCNDVNGKCTCNAYWMGDNCTVDVDECSGPNICQTNVYEVCRNFDGGYACACNSGYARPSPVDSCVDINECLYITTNTCNLEVEDCVNTNGSFSCVCKAGYIGTAGSCIACDDNHYGHGCSSLCPCHHENTLDCNDINGKCTCNAFWTGDNCTVDVDECSDPDICQTNAYEVCSNFDGGYACDCISGYARSSPGVSCTVQDTPIGPLVVSIVGVGVFIGVAVIILAVVIWKRKSGPTQHQSQPTPTDNRPGFAESNNGFTAPTRRAVSTANIECVTFAEQGTVDTEDYYAKIEDVTPAHHNRQYYNVEGPFTGHYDQLTVQYENTGDVRPYQQWSVSSDGHRYSNTRTT